MFGTLALIVWGNISQGEQALLVPLDGSGWGLLLILSLGPTLFGYLLFTVSLQPTFRSSRREFVEFQVGRTEQH